MMAENLKKSVSIFVFSDALGYELVARHDFLGEALPFRYPLGTQFGYSSTALPTILCGETPAKHRHFSFFYYARENRSPFRFFRCIHWLLHPVKLFNHHRVRNKISRFLKKIFGFTGYFNLYSVPFERLPYFDYCEKNDIFAQNGLSPCPNLRDVLLTSGVPFHHSDWRKSDAENLAEAEAALRKGDVRFVFVYTAGIDGMLHFNVGDTDAERKRLDEFGAGVRSLLAAAREKYGEVSFHVFSDHGMTPLAGTENIKAALEQPPWRFGRDYIVCYDSTMARVWFLNPACRAGMLSALEGRNGHWLSAREKADWGIDFDDDQYGEEIFLLDPGWQIVPSDMGTKAIPGMHGYAPEDRDSVACLLSLTPLAAPPRDLAGMFTLMCAEIQALREDV